MRRVGAGDFDTRVEVEGADEIATLGLAFNAMTDELRESRGRLVSANGTVETAVQAVKRGADDFLEKPLALERVLLTLERALERSRLARERDVLARERRRAVHDIDESRQVQRSGAGHHDEPQRARASARLAARPPDAGLIDRS